MPNVSFAPAPGDAERVQKVLAEISAICERERLIIAHQPSGIVIGTAPADLTAQVKVIGVCRLIAPDCYEWAPMNWTNPVDMKVGQWKTDKAN
jgi:UDP-N-acetyl-D-mannosaminuronate dehydrogenase